MAPGITSLTDQQLRQLVALLAASAISPSMERAAADIDAIGTELWRRTHGGTMAAPS
jgi:hypothetical protein